MTITTKTLHEKWMKMPEPENANYDRLTAPHAPTRDKMAELIERGELERYRKPDDVIFEETPDCNSITMTWKSREVAQEWLDFVSPMEGFISGEVIETA